jgi:phosphate transport system protein
MAGSRPSLIGNKMSFDLEESNRIMWNPEDHHSLYRQLRTEMDSVGSELAQSMQQALEALEQRNGGSAERILGRLDSLRKKEDSLKEICLRILGGKNGSTPELRWTGCSHKILSVMSGISVEIAAIARQIGKINNEPDLPIAQDLPEMGRMASRMLERSIQIALHPDADGARKIMEEDSSLDRHKDNFAEKAISLVSEHPRNSQPVVPYVLVSRHLERIGDHASHIAEEVAYYLQEQAA